MVFSVDSVNDIFSFLNDDRFGKILPLNIKQYNNKYVINCDLPGVEKEDISITVDNHELLIEVEKTIKEDKDDKFILKEISSYKKRRKIYLQKDADENSISCSLDKGILSITIPKDEKNKIKKIEIN